MRKQSHPRLTHCALPPLLTSVTDLPPPLIPTRHTLHIDIPSHVDLARLDPHHSLRLIRHWRTDFPCRRRTRFIFKFCIRFATPFLLVFLIHLHPPFLFTPPLGLRQGLAIARGTPLSPREHLADAHEDGDGTRLEDLADTIAGAALGRRSAAHLVKEGFEDGEAGVDDAEVGFEGGEHGDDGVGVLRVGGGDCGGVVYAVEGDGADTTVRGILNQYTSEGLSIGS